MRERAEPAAPDDDRAVDTPCRRAGIGEFRRRRGAPERRTPRVGASGPRDVVVNVGAPAGAGIVARPWARAVLRAVRVLRASLLSRCGNRPARACPIQGHAPRGKGRDKARGPHQCQGYIARSLRRAASRTHRKSLSCIANGHDPRHHRSAGGRPSHSWAPHPASANQSRKSQNRVRAIRQVVRGIGGFR